MRVLLPAALAVVLVCPAPSHAQETLYRPGPGVVLPKALKQVQPKYQLRRPSREDSRRRRDRGSRDEGGRRRVTARREIARPDLRPRRRRGGRGEGVAIPAGHRQRHAGERHRHAQSHVQNQGSAAAGTTVGADAGNLRRGRHTDHDAVRVRASARCPRTPGLVAPKIITMVEPKYTADAMRQKSRAMLRSTSSSRRRAA